MLKRLAICVTVALATCMVVVGASKDRTFFANERNAIAFQNKIVGNEFVYVAYSDDECQSEIGKQVIANVDRCHLLSDNVSYKIHGDRSKLSALKVKKGGRIADAKRPLAVIYTGTETCNELEATKVEHGALKDLTYDPLGSTKLNDCQQLPHKLMYEEDFAERK
eukprot:Nk52_evm30s32 gene=Nk52_evmTU30s32